MRSLALTCLILIGGCSKNTPTPSPDEHAERIKVLVKKFAYEAMPQWSMHHPDAGCPSRLEDLLTYVSERDQHVDDSWGTPFKLECGSNLPSGEKGVLVISAGPDRVFGTDDDITSKDQ